MKENGKNSFTQRREGATLVFFPHRIVSRKGATLVLHSLRLRAFA